VTIEKFRISSDGGSTWTTVSDEDVEFDIAAKNAGEVVGNFFAGAIAPGTYNRIEHTISQTFTMQGYVYYSTTNRTYYTDPNGTNGTSSVSGNVNDTSLMPGYGEADITVPGEDGNPRTTPMVEEEAVNIVVEKGVTRKVNIDFDVTDTLALYDVAGTYQLMPQAPTVTVSVE
jgi:hypothetical protein